MTLDEIRKEINQIDDKMKNLLLERMECSRKVAYAKKESGDTTVYRPDREKEILERLGKDVDPAAKKEYLAVVKKIMRASRMLQYDLLYEDNEDILKQEDSITIEFTTEDISAVFSAVFDRGFTVERFLKKDTSAYQMTLTGEEMTIDRKRLLFQLQKETHNFSIIK